MTEPSSKIIPNSFQTPNFFVDACLAYLTGNEYKCLSFLARKTFGWQKRSDRISKSQIALVTGNRCINRSMSHSENGPCRTVKSEHAAHGSRGEKALENSLHRVSCLSITTRRQA